MYLNKYVQNPDLDKNQVPFHGCWKSVKYYANGEDCCLVGRGLLVESGHHLVRPAKYEQWETSIDTLGA